jgi:hypothetical protein
MVERYGTFDRMFEFNHVVPEEKHPKYDNLIRRVISTEQLDEVDKCFLVCRECHGILHAQDIAATLHLTVTVEGKEASQELRGQIIVDKQDKRATFLTNETVLARPYRLRLGADEPKLAFGTELNAGGLLSCLADLPRIGDISVLDYRTTRVWMRARHMQGNELTMEPDVGFPVISAELFQNASDSPFIWLRNGVGLTRDGEVIHDGMVTIHKGRVPP